MMLDQWFDSAWMTWRMEHHHHGPWCLLDDVRRMINSQTKKTRRRKMTTTTTTILLYCCLVPTNDTRRRHPHQDERMNVPPNGSAHRSDPLSMMTWFWTQLSTPSKRER
jgi:hypothetical protein